MASSHAKTFASSVAGPQDLGLRKFLRTGDVMAEVDSQAEYNKIYLARHELVLFMVCQVLDLEPNKFQGLPPAQDEISMRLREEIMGRKLKPDHLSYSVENMTYQMVEVSVTKLPEQSRVKKVTKYSIIREYLSRLGYQGLQVTVCCSSDGSDLSDFETLRGADSEQAEYMRKELETFSQFLRNLHMNPRMVKYYIERNKGREIIKVKPLSSESMDRILGVMENKPLEMKFSEFEKFIEPHTGYEITEEEDKYLNDLAALALTGKVQKAMFEVGKEPEDIVKLTQEFYDRENAEIRRVNGHNPKIHPFPLLKKYNLRDNRYGEEMIELTKTVPPDMPFVTSLAASIAELNRFGDFDSFAPDMRVVDVSTGETVNRSLNNNKAHIIKVRLNQMEREEMEREGPGRKKALNNIVNPEESNRNLHLGYNQESVELILNEIEHLKAPVKTEMKRKTERMDHDQDHGVFSNEVDRCYKSLEAASVMKHLRFTELCFREIALNASRRRNKNEFLICVTPIVGVYILISPGAQLRTDQSTPIFYKTFGWAEPIETPLSHKLRWNAGWWQTRWLSTDSARITTGLRIYDSVLLTAYAMIEQATTHSGSMMEKIRLEKTGDLLELLAMTILENKSTTSQANQMSRYFVMKALGDRKFKLLFKKLELPVRSHLQSYCTQRMLAGVALMVEVTPARLISAKRREVLDTGDISEFSGAAHSKIPRIFSSGPDEQFQFILSEMYVSMLYNKDRQNKFYDSVGILNKIIKEEALLDDELQVEEKNYQMGIHSWQRVKEELGKGLDERNSHFFDAKSIMIGAKLQAMCSDNSEPGGICYTGSSITNRINKPLHKFATFKASTLNIKRSVELTNVDSLAERSKCIETTINLLKDNPGIITSLDVLYKFVEQFNVEIQIFKKNQIGGVREILILDIISRIIINVVEEVARTACEMDEREQLTSGRTKRVQMRRDQFKLIREAGETKNFWMYENADMETWCQKFLPMEFFYLYVPHKEKLKDLFNYFFLILAKHCNKRMEIPKELIRAWLNHPEMDSGTKDMNNLKRNFLETRDPTFVNKSNMGQGILHYNSSLLHLSCISLRDELYNRIEHLVGVFVQPMGQSKLLNKTMVSSDDRLTIKMIPYDNPAALQHFALFELATEMSERLHAIKKSRSKTSESSVIYEFNSNFCSSESAYSPVIKFSLASTQVFNTRSFPRMVNESYSSIRQLRENGGSSSCCYLAHLLSREFCMSLYHSSPGMTNDLESFLNLPLNKVPYDYGVYPIMDPAIMEISGPELWNYRIYREQKEDHISLVDNLLGAIYQPKKIEEEDEPSLEGENFLWSEDIDSFDIFKRCKLEIKQGLVTQMQKMRERTGASMEKLDERMKEQPLFMLKSPSTNEEVLDRCYAVLFTPGAADSLRHVSPSMLYLRTGAAANGSYWKHLNTSSPMTYKNAIISMLNMQSSMNMSRELEMTCFPEVELFEWMIQSTSGEYVSVGQLPENMPMSVRDITLNRPTRILYGNITQLLLTFLDPEDEREASAKDESDWQLVKSKIPMLKDSLEEMVEMSNRFGESIDRILIAMLRILSSYKTRRAQVYMYGRSTRTVDDTLNMFMKYNTMKPITFKGTEARAFQNLPFEIGDYTKTLLNACVSICMENYDVNLSQAMDSISMVMTRDGEELIQDGRSVARRLINSISLVRSLNQRDQALAIIMVLLLPRDEIQDYWRYLLEESSFCKLSWIIEQNKVAGEWTGPFKLAATYKNESAIIESADGENWTLRFGRVINNRDFYHLVLKMCSTIKSENTTVIPQNMIGEGIISFDRFTKSLKFHKKQENSIRTQKETSTSWASLLEYSKVRPVVRLDKFRNKLLVVVPANSSYPREWEILRMSAYNTPININAQYKLKDKYVIQGFDAEWLFNKGLLDSLNFELQLDNVEGLIDKIDMMESFMDPDAEIKEAFDFMYSEEMFDSLDEEGDDEMSRNEELVVDEDAVFEAYKSQNWDMFNFGMKELGEDLNDEDMMEDEDIEILGLKLSDIKKLVTVHDEPEMAKARRTARGDVSRMREPLVNRIRSLRTQLVKKVLDIRSIREKKTRDLCAILKSLSKKLNEPSSVDEMMEGLLMDCKNWIRGVVKYKGLSDEDIRRFLINDIYLPHTPITLERLQSSMMASLPVAAGTGIAFPDEQ